MFRSLALLSSEMFNDFVALVVAFNPTTGLISVGVPCVLLIFCVEVEEDVGLIVSLSVIVL